MRMKKYNQYTNIYFVSGFFVFVAVVYLVTYIMMTSNISGSSSVEIYHKQLQKERMIKSQQ